MADVDLNLNCFHCGADCPDKTLVLNDKYFCCLGCKTVYEILNSHNMAEYYEMNIAPGQTRLNKKKRDFSYLEKPEIQQQLLDFSDDGISVINLFLPAIHCSSCIWLLEHINHLKDGILHSQVNFAKRSARITFKHDLISLIELVELLVAIGYEPTISLEDAGPKKNKIDRSLLYKIGIAGFAFGNVMIMALPEYFDYEDSTLQMFLPFFRWIMLGLSVPVVVFSASEYFVSAIKGLRHKYMNIDVPIALGILVLFLRSSYDIFTNSGPGYFDSLTGLVFFLLLGKIFQRKTYDSLSFERDYKSYFPIAVTKLGDKEESIAVSDLKTGDRILIRNEELIPADCILLKGNALIDNSFVTGEATPIKKISGDKIFAGGKQLGEAIEVEIIKPVNQSYLTQLWNHAVFNKTEHLDFKNFTDRISKHFTIAIMIVATMAAGYWYIVDSSKVFTVFTAILIVACPCALALSAPFTLGNVLRIFGRNKFFVKDANSVERLAEINYLVWDKTGTLTASHGSKLQFVGPALAAEDVAVFKAMARQSNHPLSRMLFNFLPEDVLPISDFKEFPGKGTEAALNRKKFRLGAASFCHVKQEEKRFNETRIYLAIESENVGYFKVQNEYRAGVFDLIKRLNNSFSQTVLSGDGAGERDVLQPVFGDKSTLYFNQKPADKLALIEKLQEKSNRVLMVGDGLNDAGALKQSNFGISISEDVNAFSPACDAILDASKITDLDKYLIFAQKAKKIIIASFILSFSYNLVGLSFAAAGLLSPVVSAILMPLSSITIVVFVTLASNWVAKKMNL